MASTTGLESGVVVVVVVIVGSFGRRARSKVPGKSKTLPAEEGFG
jgi:hypothetical protein